jgi:hypothetical protein
MTHLLNLKDSEINAINAKINTANIIIFVQELEM